MFFWNQEPYIRIRKKKGNFHGLILPFFIHVLKIHWYILYYFIWKSLFVTHGHNKAWEIIDLVKNNPKVIKDNLFVAVTFWGLLTLIRLVANNWNYKESILIRNIKWYIKVIKAKKVNKTFWKNLIRDIFVVFELNFLLFIFAVYIFVLIGLKPMTIYMELNLKAETVFYYFGYILITIKVLKEIFYNIKDEKKRVNIK